MFGVDDSEPCYEGDRFYSMMGSICRYGKLAMNDVTSPVWEPLLSLRFGISRVLPGKFATRHNAI